MFWFFMKNVPEIERFFVGEMTPLEIAVANEHVVYVVPLLNYGANLDLSAPHLQHALSELPAHSFFKLSYSHLIRKD
jgi:ankyrin repeat protein